MIQTHQYPIVSAIFLMAESMKQEKLPDLPDEIPTEKICENIECGKTYPRPEGISARAWMDRKACSRACGFAFQGSGK